MTQRNWKNVIFVTDIVDFRRPGHIYTLQKLDSYCTHKESYGSLKAHKSSIQIRPVLTGSITNVELTITTTRVIFVWNYG